MVARPVWDETDHQANTTSIATSPLAASCVITNAGYISRLTAAAGGTTTGTVTVAVAINGGSDITGGNLTVAAGTGARNGGVLELPVAIGTCFYVNEGDCITFTPSGGTGASIPGAFGLVVRNL
jgi:hypothetical protein